MVILEAEKEEGDNDGASWTRVDTEALLVAVFGAGMFIGVVVVAYSCCSCSCSTPGEHVSLLGTRTDAV